MTGVASMRGAGLVQRLAGAVAGRVRRRSTGHDLVPPLVRWSGIVWVAVSMPVIVAASFRVDSQEDYILVMVLLAGGAYTTPGLVAGWHAVRRAPAGDRTAFWLLYTGLTASYVVGLAMLVGQITGWRWGNPGGLPAIIVSGTAHSVGLVLLVRSRSGRRALSVDVIEALAVVVAVTAPLVVLWGPAVMEADARWFAVPAAAILPFTIWGVYWTTTLFVRLGPGRQLYDVCALALAAVGTVNATLQTAQGISGFTLPAPPLIAAQALCFSMYLLLPLYMPLLFRPGLDRLPPQAQVRGARLATAVAMAGLAALLVATALVAGERPWAVPFSLGVVSLLFILGGLRQMATVGETRRLYRQVEEASEERRRLLDQLLERSIHERQDFASYLYETTVAAYTSFRALAGAGRQPVASPAAVDAASALVVGDLARQAESAREMMMALRPVGAQPRHPQRLATPLTAYLATVYGDLPAPRLTVSLAEELALDWTTETMLLQIAREALRNVRHHSQATAVDLAIEPDGSAVVLRVADDGVGFDPATRSEGTGIATMRASAAVLGGTLTVASRPGGGTAVTARLGRTAEAPASTSPGRPPAPPTPPGPPDLRLVPGLADD